MVPADEDLFKFQVRISYGASYPYSRSNAQILAIGKVSADGKQIDTISEHLAVGIGTFEIGPIKTPSRTSSSSTRSFEMSLNGKWDASSPKAAAETALGPWDMWQWVVFLDGSSNSLGEASSKSWSTGSGGEFNRSAEWTGSLKPGTKVEIGLVPGKPDDYPEFIFDRSSLTTK